jgi:hypothetical protein
MRGALFLFVSGSCMHILRESLFGKVTPGWVKVVGPLTV